MPTSNVLLISQIAGHVAVLTLSLCILVPMVCHNSDFNGNCLLFSSGDWQEDTGLFDVKWASKFYCNFTILTGVFLLLVSSVEIYRYESDFSLFLCPSFPIIKKNIFSTQ